MPLSQRHVHSLVRHFGHSSGRLDVAWGLYDLLTAAQRGRPVPNRANNAAVAMGLLEVDAIDTDKQVTQAIITELLCCVLGAEPTTVRHQGDAVSASSGPTSSVPQSQPAQQQQHLAAFVQEGSGFTIARLGQLVTDAVAAQLHLAPEAFLPLINVFAAHGQLDKCAEVILVMLVS